MYPQTPKWFDPDAIGLIRKEAVNPKEGKYPGLRPNLVEHIDGMEIIRDVAVPMRDGIKIYADIFRAKTLTGSKLPTLMTWSPYGKHGPKTFDLFPGSGVPEGTVSRHAVWEGCDPLYWTKRGYAVLNGDSRGSWGSEGTLEILSPQIAYDGYDVIEWIASQPWSNGRVGLCGVSYLAIVQWRIAQLNPPHLSCINPWEGYTDAYRDHTHPGGIPETKFLHFSDWSCQFSAEKTENWYLSNQTHELMDDYNQSKRATDLPAIKVPAYIVIDWGDHGLHTRGALNGFTYISSKQKWLEVHGRKKWQYFYQESSLARQEAFYRKFLKDEPSEVDEWPPVRIEIRDQFYQGHWRDEQEWPLNRTRFAMKYLDSPSNELKDELPVDLSSVSYDSTTQENAQFTYTFKQETELTGSMRLRLWVSTTESDDLDLFVRLDKLNEKGETLPFVAFSMFDDGPLALGWLRASHRELDPSFTHHNRPWMKHQRKLLLRPGEIVPVDVEIVASSTRFLKGESLKVTIQGTDAFSNDGVGPSMKHENSVNKGRHVIHTGGVFDSYLVMPIIDP
ncbi:uncharacterized protein Z519_04160 [Cladophialophora bantiana CBS 173.52]|uniref:Xaa-Pro dipeptidyl-peptidase C-terminal domain-containing protein n=1 Tax=Cladophialophora bantiana (strain ATCC 10958 / CBS 173.52 / CDC B-1940 / NIH 8579) TaxID=1442370 RepID=A0A0D2HXC2_CLAB1|nr:uncharacterized protein Z519_04160 [Cladophialophora bantiana CBS 173.52]KIW95575.1 hypothetical protein Z519_04160 [Cladophialophora bantiana CBS 173.52]